MRLRRDEHEHDPGTERLEMFSDGVFAIAITLLIIEIGVPIVSSDESLSDELWHLWPEIGAYILSFLTIGIYWANHNALFRLFVRTDHIFLMLNVLFLMCVAFLPFPTAVLGEYVDDAPERQAAVAFYTLGLLLPALGWCSVWVYGVWDRLLDERLHPDYVRFLTIQYLVSVALYTAAFLVSFVQPYVALAVTVGLTFLYLLPPRARRYIIEEIEEGVEEIEDRFRPGD
jgi:uncharacterized membrane protein